MNNALLKDANLRTLVARVEYQRLLYKAILQDRSLPQSLRYEFMFKLNKVSKKSSAVRTKNRCVMTGRVKVFFEPLNALELLYENLSQKEKLSESQNPVGNVLSQNF